MMYSMSVFTFYPDDGFLILDTTSFIGRRLVSSLTEQHIRLRILGPTLLELELITLKDAEAEIINGDLAEGSNLEEALKGIHSCFYLVLSMGGKSITRNGKFAEKDKRAARNTIRAADRRRREDKCLILLLLASS